MKALRAVRRALAPCPSCCSTVFLGLILGPLGLTLGFLGSLLILLGPLWGRRGFILGSKNGFGHQQCPKSRQRGATPFSHSPFWRPFSTPNRSKLDPRWVSRGMPKTITKKIAFQRHFGTIVHPRTSKKFPKTLYSRSKSRVPPVPCKNDFS